VNAQVTLDIEVAGAVAPSARVVVYFAPNTKQGFLDAVSQAVNDKVSVISISWGSAESFWSRNEMESMNSVMERAAVAGISVVAAVGDNGVTDGVTDRHPHVDFPASSPYVLAVGGTRITVSGGAIKSEVAWSEGGGNGLSATGGGVSDIFPLPVWQQNVKVPRRVDGGTGRGLPDVAALADPSWGYKIFSNGSWTVLGGTAAGTPLWAGLIALINQAVGQNIGFINPILYQKIGPSGVLRDVVQGNNSVGGIQGYAAGPGWNAVAGWGSPDGRKLLAAFQH
jgi:kumamolisin